MAVHKECAEEAGEVRMGWVGVHSSGTVPHRLRWKEDDRILVKEQNKVCEETTVSRAAQNHKEKLDQAPRTPSSLPSALHAHLRKW